jgi:hypothetical protein
LPKGIACLAIKDRKIAIAYSAIRDCQKDIAYSAIKERQIVIAYLVIKIAPNFQRLLSNIRMPYGQQ